MDRDQQWMASLYKEQMLPNGDQTWIGTSQNPHDRQQSFYEVDTYSELVNEGQCKQRLDVIDQIWRQDETATTGTTSNSDDELMELMEHELLNCYTTKKRRTASLNLLYN